MFADPSTSSHGLELDLIKLTGLRHWRILRRLMRFVETPMFTSVVQRHLDDERYRQLQIALMLRPEQGPVIRGSGGLRKLRWATGGRGKRGGLRVIDYWARDDEAFYMLYVYSKSEQGDLTPEQTQRLGRVVRAEFK